MARRGVPAGRATPLAPFTASLIALLASNVRGHMSCAEIAADVPFILGRWLPQPPQKRGRKPTDDELRDRWLGRNPHYAFGQGEWKRYEGGTYAPVDAEAVLNAIEAVLVDAKPERIRPTTGLRNSVAELARTKTYHTTSGTRPAEVNRVRHPC